MSEEAPDYLIEEMNRRNNIENWQKAADMHGAYYLRLVTSGVSQAHALDMTIQYMAMILEYMRHGKADD